MSDQKPSLERKTPGPTSVDAGSQALSEALASGFTIVWWAMVVMFVVFLFSGIFIVGPQEQVIILRFGKPVGEGQQALLGPGPHWAWPYPIDEKVKVPITTLQTVSSTVGWYFQSSAQAASGFEPPPNSMSSINPTVDGYVLTADGNIVHTKATVAYQIQDPKQFVFGFANGTDHAFNFAGASNAVQNALDNSLLYTAAHFNVDDMLIANVTGFKESVRRRFEMLVARDNLGIIVQQFTVDSRAPRQLKGAFDAVVNAGQNRKRILSDAQAHENQVLSKATADASGRINIAETERKRSVEGIAAEAEVFNGLLPNYEANPSLFTRQALARTMSVVLTNVQFKTMLPDPTGKQLTKLWLSVSKEVPKQTTTQTRP